MDEVAGEVLQVLDEELQGLKDAYFSATGEWGLKHLMDKRPDMCMIYHLYK